MREIEMEIQYVTSERERKKEKKRDLQSSQIRYEPIIYSGHWDVQQNTKYTKKKIYITI